MAKFTVKTTYDDLPKEVIHQTKRLILDLIGNSLAGRRSDLGKIVLRLVEDLGGRPKATIIGSRNKTSCVNAAFANAELCNALDLADVILWRIQLGTYAFPAALAVGERIKATGKDVINSIVLGCDMSARYALSLPGFVVRESPPNLEVDSPELGGSGYHTFGAAAAAGRLLGLNEDEMAHAFGIAGFCAPVPLGHKWFATTPSSMVKYSLCGSIVQCGVLAALLAERGFTGDQTVMDGDNGFWKTHANTFNWNTLTSELGRRWYIMETSFKPYPCCRWIQPILDLIQRIVREKKLKPERIDRVVVRLNPFFAHSALLNMTELRSAMDVQFSIRYLVSVAIHQVPIIDWNSSAIMSEPKIVNFMNKVTVEEEPKWARVVYEETKGAHGHFTKCPASVKIISRGRTFERYTEQARGDPWTSETRMSDDELKEKFRMLSSKVLQTSKIEKVIDTIFKLEKVQNIHSLTKLLSSRARRVSISKVIDNRL